MSANTAEIISVAESLPLEMRLEIISRLWESVQPTNRDIDEAWMVEARRRSGEIKAGKVVPVPGDVVMAKVKKRFGL